MRIHRLHTATAVCLIVGFATLPATPAFAQEKAGVSKRGFFYVAPGFSIDGEITTIHLGGGLETVWSNGMGFAFDAGYLSVAEFDPALLSLAPAFVYEFPVDRKLKPYVRGGMTFLVADGGAAGGLWNLGGGVNYWFKNRMGVKVEVRNSFDGSAFQDGLLDFMAGLIFKY